jgi:two-component system, response regulator RegA
MSAPAPTLLLLDDDETGRFVLAAMLEDSGYRVTEASSIAGARALLETQAFDVAILDLELGDGHGSDLIPALARAHPHTMIAVLSGRDLEPIPHADTIITKAIEPTELLARLERALTIKRAIG